MNPLLVQKVTGVLLLGLNHFFYIFIRFLVFAINWLHMASNRIQTFENQMWFYLNFRM